MLEKGVVRYLTTVDGLEGKFIGFKCHSLVILLGELSRHAIELTSSGAHAQILLEELAKALLVVPLAGGFSDTYEAPVPLLQRPARIHELPVAILVFEESSEAFD